MAEGQSHREQEKSPPIADMVGDIFERRAKNYREGNRKLILEMYQDKFAKLVEALPPEQQANTSIKIQKFIVKIGGYVNEYGARFSDFVRGIALWPMAKAVPDFPKDKYYQFGIARAKAWGEFAMNTTKTATAERRAYRDYFLPSALTGAQVGAAVGIGPAILAGAAYGSLEGAKIGVLGGGVVGGLAGAAAGGAIGAGVMGGATLMKRLNDRLIGEPAVFYELFSPAYKISFNKQSSSPVYTSGWQAG